MIAKVKICWPVGKATDNHCEKGEGDRTHETTVSIGTKAKAEANTYHETQNGIPINSELEVNAQDGTTGCS